MHQPPGTPGASPQPEALPPGTVLLNRYEILSFIGGGGFGAIYEVRDLALGHRRAIKEAFGLDPQAQHQFRLEAEFLLNVQHPNLVRGYAVFEQGNKLYLVMEYVDGQTLEDIAIDYIRRTGRALPERQVIEWILPVCDAVFTLHAQPVPIIHRDVKPANIKLSQRHGPVLIDLGLAKLYAEGTQTVRAALAFTPGYAPPEQYRASGATDRRTDIYGLGASLFYLFTGYQPTEAPARLSAQALPMPRTLNPLLSPASEAVVLKAMALDPAERYQDAHAMAADLQQALALLRPSAPLGVPLGERGAASYPGALGASASGYASTNAALPAVAVPPPADYRASGAQAQGAAFAQSYPRNYAQSYPGNYAQNGVTPVPGMPVGAANPSGPVCARCGVANPRSARYCMRCGAEVGTASPQQPVAEQAAFARSGVLAGQHGQRGFHGPYGQYEETAAHISAQIPPQVPPAARRGGPAHQHISHASGQFAVPARRPAMRPPYAGIRAGQRARGNTRGQAPFNGRVAAFVRALEDVWPGTQPAAERLHARWLALRSTPQELEAWTSICAMLAVACLALSLTAAFTRGMLVFVLPALVLGHWSLAQRPLHAPREFRYLALAAVGGGYAWIVIWLVALFVTSR